jgi:hypothetical protein
MVTGFYPRVAKDLLGRNIAGYTADFKSAAVPQFKFFEPGYQDDLRQMIAQVKTDLSFVPKVNTVQETVVRVSVLRPGDHAIVIVDHHLDGSAVGRDHKTHDLVIGGRSQDMWRQVGGAWKLVSSTWISHLYMKDGVEPRSRGMLPGPGKSRFGG